IVPEIEMPGHATAAIVAYPELGVGDTDRGPSGAPAEPRAQSAPESPRAMASSVPSDWGIYSNLYNVDDSTFQFLENVLTEVIDLFPSPYIHIGGDEAVKTQWEHSPRVQARMRELGVADSHALQSYFVQRIERFLSAHGRRLIGWDEILEGGLAPNATVMSWRGVKGGITAAKSAHDVVMSPTSNCYFDYYQAKDGKGEPKGIGGFLPLETVYAYEPWP